MANKTTKTDIVFKDEVIILRSVYPKSDIRYFIQPCRDKYGNLPSSVKLVNSNGDMIMSEAERDAFAAGTLALFPITKTFELTDGKTYHLTDIWEKAEWEAVKHCKLIVADRNARDKDGNLIIDGARSSASKPARNGIAELYIDRPGLEAQRRVTRKQKVHTACSFIYDDPHGADGQLNMARILGKNMKNQPIADVIDFLIRIAEEDPDKIINLYTGDDISLRLVFIEAREKKVIYIKNKLYLYGDNIVLGATDDAVIAWMRNPKNQKVLELIKKDTYPDYYPEDKVK